MTRTGIIYGVNGPIVHVKGDVGFEMHEMVTVGKDHLVGEVIGLASDSTTIQVYEETSGLGPGEPVEGSSRARPWKERELPYPPPWPPAF